MIPDGDQQTNDGATHNKNVDKSNKLSTNSLEETLMDNNYVMMMVLKQ